MPKPLNEPNAILHQSDYDDLIETLYDEYLIDSGGETVFPRSSSCVGNAQPSSQMMLLAGFRCKKTAKVSTLTVVTNSGAVNTPSICRMGVYLYDGSTTLNLVASTPNDNTLFEFANLSWPKDLSVPFTKIRGRDYCVGLLVVSAVGMPSFQGPSPSGGTNLRAVSPPIKIAALTGQANLPASIAVGSLISSYTSFQALMT